MQIQIDTDRSRQASQDLSGLIAGTTILTMDGDLPVDHLSTGDRIITRDTGMTTLRAIQTHKIFTQTIAIKPGSLGHTRADRQAHLLPQTKILIRDWRAPALYGVKDALIAAQRLTDGNSSSPCPRKTSASTAYSSTRIT